MGAFEVVSLILMILSTVYSAASSVQNASRLKDAQKQAEQDYYRALQKGQTQSRVFKASSASAKTAEGNAKKYTGASEQLANEASAREKQSRPDAYSGYRPRSTKQRMQDFGNKRSAKAYEEEDPNLHLQLPLLNFVDFSNRDFLKTNFNVENLNTNYLGEV